jgi:hypothetical protein
LKKRIVEGINGFSRNSRLSMKYVRKKVTSGKIGQLEKRIKGYQTKIPHINGSN